MSENERISHGEEIWSWRKTEKEIRSMHMDPFYNIYITSGLQLRKTFNFNHAIDYLAASTCFGGETFIAVQSLVSKSIVHIWNTVQNKNCKVKLQYKINSFIIVHSLMIGVALCGDGKLRIFTSVPTLVEVGVFTLEKPATYPVYNPFRKDLLLGGISEVNVWSFCEANKNEPKTLLSEVLRMNLKRGQTFWPQIGEEWVTCITIDERSVQVVVAGEETVCIADAITYHIKHVIRTYINSTITQCTLYTSMDYIITGHQDGMVYFWSVTSYNSVHKLKAHQAKITGMEVHYGMDLLITVSLDKTIKALRLSTLAEVYNIMSGDKMNNLKVLDRNSLAYCTKYCVKVWNLYQVDSLVNRIFSEVYRIKRTGENLLLLETEDGGLRVVSCRDGQIITTVFSTTNTCNFTLKNSAYSSSRTMCFVLNEESGHIEGYNCETHPATLSAIYKSDGQKVAALCEAYLGIPYWLPTAKRAKLKTETMLCILLVGTVEGQLIVSDAPEWLHLPPPINIERGFVQNMVASPAGEGDKKCTLAVLTGESPSYISIYLLSISTDNNLSISLRHVITLTTQVTFFHISNVYLMVTFDNIFTLVKFPSILEKVSLHNTLLEPTTTFSESYIEIHKHSPTDGHTKTITDMDALSTLEIFATVAAEDFFLKLWDNKNTLIREILFSSPVFGICFVSEWGTMFCTNQTNINVIPVTKYLPPQYIQRLLDIEFIIPPYERMISIASSATFEDPDIIPISLYNRRKEKITRLQASDGRFSKYGRRKRDPPRDDGDSSKGAGRRRGTAGRDYSGSRGGDKSEEKDKSGDCDKTNSSDCTEKSYKAPLLPLPETITPILEEDASRELMLVPQDSEYTIIEQAMPCAPDGYIPNSVARIFFSHLLEFQVLFDQSFIPNQPLQTIGHVSANSHTLPTTISDLQLSANILPVTSLTDIPSMHGRADEGQFDALGDSKSYLFASTTTEDVDSLLEETGSYHSSSQQLLDSIISSTKTLQEKRSTFAEIALKESPSYKNAERVPRKSQSKKSLQFQDISEIKPTDMVAEEAVTVKEEPKVEELVEEKPEEKSPSPKPKPKKEKSSRKLSTAQKNKPEGIKKRKMSKARKTTEKKQSETTLSPKLSDITSELAPDEYPQQPLVTITIPEKQPNFTEKLTEIAKLPDSREKLLALLGVFELARSDEERLVFVRNFDEFIYDISKNSFHAEDVELVKECVLNMLYDDHIDLPHAVQLFKHLMDFEMSDHERFGVLTSLIKVQGDKGKQTCKDVLLEMLPFLVHDDEVIKTSAFEALNEFANVNNKEELRDLLVSMGILRDTAQSTDIDIKTDGKVLNVQYWKNKLDQPQNSMVRSKTSEEIQIVSEVEISIDSKNLHMDNSDTITSSMSDVRTAKTDGNTTTKVSMTELKSAAHPADTLTSLIHESPLPARTPLPSLVSLEKYVSDMGDDQVSSDDEVLPKEEVEEEEQEDEEESNVVVPSIDIKRKILSTEEEDIPIKTNGEQLGTVKQKGKLFNSSNDLMMWFKEDEDRFYDSKDRLVGALLPNGNVSVPQDAQFFVNRVIMGIGAELVKFAHTCDNQGRIKNSRGETLGRLTKEGEFISKEGLVFNCDGVYVGKKCANGNRMYVNGEIFDPENRYWGHVGPDNTMIHLSGAIFDSSGIKIGDIGDYGAKLLSCVKNEEDNQNTDSGVSLDDRYVNKNVVDTDGSVLGKYKNKDTIITTCGDIFDRGGVYVGQLLANGHVMMKEEATKVLAEVRSNVASQGKSRGRSRGTAKPSSRNKSRTVRSRDRLLDAQMEENRRRRTQEIAEEWSRHRHPSTETDKVENSDGGYCSEEKLLFDLTQSVPLLPTLNDIRGQRLVKTITFSRSVSALQNKNFHIEPMPSILNAHTTTSDGNTNFGMLKVDWTTRSFDPGYLKSSKLPSIGAPPPSALPAIHPAMKDSSPITLPNIHPKQRGGFSKIIDDKKTPSDYIMKMVSSYLKREIEDEMSLIKRSYKDKTNDTRQVKICTTPISNRQNF